MNRIFSCRNKVTDEKVLLRLYGGKLLEQDNFLRGGCVETEVLIFHVMAERGIGPQLLGVFPGGRLEQFIENSDTLSAEDCQDSDLMSAFARKLAQFHATPVPVSKTPKDIFAIVEPIFISKWDKYVAFVKTKELPAMPEMQQAAETVYGYDFLSMTAWLKQYLSAIKTRVVLSHNDMNKHNFLVRKDVSDPDQKIVFLDFEFACSGHRGCDIGNHFQNRTIDIKEFMKGNMVPLPYPDEKDRRCFVQAYLEEAKKHSDEWDESVDNESNLLLEAEYFGALYQIFFAAFIVNDHEKWKDMQMPIHPALMFAGVIRDLEDRRNRIVDLMQRGSLG